MGGSSRQSLAIARKKLDEKLKGLSASDCAGFSKDLFAVLAALDSSTGLRRAFTDPARDASSKSALAKELFGEVVSASALGLVCELAILRWSAPSNLGNAIEQLAIEAEAASANAADELDRLEQELFAFSQIVASGSELRQALNGSKYSLAGKSSLVSELLGKKVSGSTLRLLVQLVCGLRGRNIESTIYFYSAATAARRDRVIAHVRTATGLSPAQEEKLTLSLAKKIGQPVRINIEIDPTVLGGLSIRFADESIDGTIVNRLADASRALVG